jgi:hypothetical protein
MLGRWSAIKKRNLVRSIVCLASCLLFPQISPAWGKNGQKLVLNKAIDTLPPEIQFFFENGRSQLLQHVLDPFEAAEKSMVERRNHHIFFEKYGRFPFEALPRDYKAALAKVGKSKLDSSGLLPWQIGLYSQKLTESMRAGKWDEARLNAAILANYVSEAHDPFNTTDNSDGHLSGQLGVHERFGTTLIERYSAFFPMRPNDAAFISDPTDHAFDVCLSSHSWLETILYADLTARHSELSYTDEYYDRFYNQAAAILIRQLSNAASDVGSYWLTAWQNAGKPQLPH